MNQSEISKAAELRECGLTYRDIGKQLGKSHKTIMRWLKPDFAAADKEKTKAYHQTPAGRLSHLNAVTRYRKTEAGKKTDRRYENKRKASDPCFLLKYNLRKRLNSALRGNYKSGSAIFDLGCSIDELKTHLQNQFQEGMSWENYGEWHIDHIKPLASFDLTNRDHFLQACHYTNLQPLWAVDNIKKGNKCPI